MDIGYKIRAPSLSICIISSILFTASLSLSFTALGAPVIVDGDSQGFWEDGFEDTLGIESWQNLTLVGGNIKLSTKTIIHDSFTGTDGDPPNSSIWDKLDDGYTLEIQSNQLKSSASPPPSTWKDEMVQNNQSISRNHTLTWRQNLHTNSGNAMFYHFFALNGSDDSWLFGVQQNNINNYILISFINYTEIIIDTSVSGWHDFKVTYHDGAFIFYFDGMLICDWDFNVAPVKYQFGTHCLNGPSTIYTDDIEIVALENEGHLMSTEIMLPADKTWKSLEIDKIDDEFGQAITVSILDGTTLLPITGFENLSWSDIDISTIDSSAHPTIRLMAFFSGYTLNSPVLSRWKVSWHDTIPPDTPTGLTISNPFTGYSLILNWNANTEQDLDVYVLYCSTDNVTFHWVANLSSEPASFINYGLNVGVTYHYKIAAADEVPNQSSFSYVVEGVPDLDYDGDGIGNIADPDDDNDGIPDIDDPYPYLDVNDMEITLDNLALDVASLRAWLENVIASVEANINATNQTLHQQLAIQDALMTSFYDSLTSDLGDIHSDLILHDQNTGENHSVIIALINDILDGQIEKEKIAELRTMLIDLAGNLSDHDQAIADDIIDVVNNIDEFEMQTDEQLQRINQTLLQLEQLEDILIDLNFLDQSLDEAEENLQNSIDDTSTRKEDDDRMILINLLLILVLILLFINLILTFVMRKRSEPDESPAQPGDEKASSNEPELPTPPPPQDQ